MNSQTISLVRFPLAFAVVFIHCQGEVMRVTNWSEATVMDAYYTFKLIISSGIAQVAVPMFFFISGFLFFNKVEQLDWEIYRTKLTKRVRSLLVPFILWNLLCIPLTLLVMYGESLSGSASPERLHDYWSNINWPHLFWDATAHDDSYVNLFGTKQLQAYPILDTFWYVRDLIAMTLLTPLIYCLYKTMGKVGLLLVAACIVLRLWPYMTVTVHSLFFVLGCYWGMNHKELYIGNKLTRRLNYLLTLALILLLAYYQCDMSREGWLLMPLFRLSAIGTVFCLARNWLMRHPGFQFPSLLSRSGFFVYAIHIEFTLPLGFFITKAIFHHTQQPLLLTIQYVTTPIVHIVVYMLSHCQTVGLFQKGTKQLQAYPILDTFWDENKRMR